MKKVVENVGYEVHVSNRFGNPLEHQEYLDVVAKELNGDWVDDANDVQSYDFKNVMDAFNFQYNVRSNGYGAVVEMLKFLNNGSVQRIKVS